jgi:hypothetical protein
MRDDQRLAGLIFDLTWRRGSNAIRSTSTATVRCGSPDQIALTPPLIGMIELLALII